MMERNMFKRLHRLAGIAALLLAVSFLSVTTYAELSHNATLIYKAKRFVVLAIPFMLLFMPLSALSGKKMAGNSKNSIIKRKNRRLRFIAANGAILVTLAIWLYLKAAGRHFDMGFWILQGLELALGLLNIVLLSLMARDGMKLSGRITS
jgi:hypothetical protein